MKLKDTLGATVLTLADQGWTWLAIVGLHPQPTQRYGWWRVASRALVSGTLLGGAASLVVGRSYGIPLPGWAFEWGFWVGLGCSATWQTLTALAWNRRAARLVRGETPGAPDKRLPWWLRWLLGPAYVLVLGIAVPFLLVLGVANLRAKMAWERYRAELVADGVKLTATDLLPGTIPDGENVAMAPFFAPMLPLFSRPRNDNASRKSDWERFGRTIDTVKLPSKVVATEGPVAFRQEALDPAAVQREFRESKDFSNHVALADSATGLIETLGYAEPQLALLREALTRPHSRFPLHYEDAFGMLLPHLTPMRNQARVLAMRAGALAQAGRGDEALVDTVAAFRLADAVGEEPILISGFVSFAIRSLATGSVWEGLRAQVWNDAQLVRLDAALARSSVEETLRRGFDGERALSTLGILKLEGNREMSAELVGTVVHGIPAPLPGFLFYRNVIEVNRLLDAALERHPQDPATVHAKERLAKLPERPAGRPNAWDGTDPRIDIAQKFMPAVSTDTNRVNRVLAEQRLARTAVALERFHLVKGTYPTALSQLVPSYLEKTLPDPFTGESFQYQATPDGRFKVWSLGPNRRDDHGVMGKQAFSKHATATEPDDIAWTYLKPQP
jgi:hypothetical protein